MPATPLPSLQDRRRRRTREAIMRAGQALFAERSVDGVSIDDVVRAADVAKGSFYNHFTDKEDLAREIAAGLRDFSETCIDEANAGIQDAADRVARALCVQIRFAADRPEEARASNRLFFGATLTDMPHNAGVTRDMRRGLDSGRFEGVSVQAGILMIMGVITAGLLHASSEAGQASPTQLAHDMALGLLRGLGVPGPDARRAAEAACADILGAGYTLGDRR